MHVKIPLDRARITLLLLLAALLAIGAWAYRGVGDSLREIRATGLKTLLDTQVETLEQWIAEGRNEAARLAADPDLADAIARLVRGDADGKRIIEDLLHEAGRIGITAAHVIDAQGAILASSMAGRAGRGATPDFFSHLAPALSGQPVFVRPRHGGGAQPGHAWVAAPVRAGNGRIIAVIALGSPAEQRFADLFKVARPGETGESLAFDAEGNETATVKVLGG